MLVWGQEFAVPRLQWQLEPKSRDKAPAQSGVGGQGKIQTALQFYWKDRDKFDATF